MKTSLSAYIENQILIMKQYKVESRAFFSKVTTDKEHIVDSSMDDIQGILDHYVDNGWTLFSTNSSSFGRALYVHLYFEKG